MLLHRTTSATLITVISTVFLAGCAASGSFAEPSVAISETTESTTVVPTGLEEEGEGRSLLVSLLLYLPNRVLDLFDLARAGVDVGPGFGVDIQATGAAQAKARSVASVGVGYQTLRHLPVQASAEVAAAIGPVGSNFGAPLPWYRSWTDVRLGFHVALIGSHVAIDVQEWVDFPLGFLGLDIAGDDL